MFSRSLRLKLFVSAAGFYFGKKIVCFDYPFQACLRNLKTKHAFADAELPQESDFFSSTPSPDCPMELKDVMFSQLSSNADYNRWDANWDKRGCVTQQPGLCYRKIILIRHGHYNEDPIANIPPFGHLTPTGNQQAAYTGNRLKYVYQSDGNDKIAKIVTSIMTRAQQTSTIIQSKLNMNNITATDSDMIKEGYPCEGIPQSKVVPEYHYFQNGARIEAAFRNIMFRPLEEEHAGKAEIYVCHANVIRYFLMRSLQFPEEMWTRFALANGSITELLIFPNGEIIVVAVGEFSHLREPIYGCN